MKAAFDSPELAIIRIEQSYEDYQDDDKPGFLEVYTDMHYSLTARDLLRRVCSRRRDGYTRQEKKAFMRMVRDKMAEDLRDKLRDTWNSVCLIQDGWNYLKNAVDNRNNAS